MRRLLIAALVAFTLVLPTAALAAPTTLKYYGMNTHGGDLVFYNPAELNTAQTADFSLRAGMDACRGDVYGPIISGQVAARDIELLPVLGWSDCNGNPADIDTALERSIWRGFCHGAVQKVNDSYAAAGRTPPNAFEVWNEPNKYYVGGSWGFLSDFWNNVYVPCYNGIREVDADANVIVGGLCFGTEASNGCNDANNWINAIIGNGWSNIVNAYSIHPYGFTNTQTWVREDEQYSNYARANEEYKRACQPSTIDPVIVTESGRRSDNPYPGWDFTEAYQSTFLWQIRNYMDIDAGGHFVWPGRDIAGTGSGTKGLLRAAGNPNGAENSTDRDNDEQL